MSDDGGVVEIVVQFDDGACLKGDLHVDYLPAETGVLEHRLEVSVAGGPKDAGAYDRMRLAVILAVDIFFEERTPPSALESNLKAVLEQMMPSPALGTQAQQRNMRKFQRSPLAPPVIPLVRKYCDVATRGLPAGSIGMTWGLTVMAGNGIALVNVGNKAAMAIASADNCMVYLKGDRLPVPAGVHAGLLQGYKDLEPNFGLRVAANDLDALIDLPEFARAMRAQVDQCHAARTTLQQANWHNPLTESVFW